MLVNISWTNYIIFVLLLLAVWYISIGFKFYFPIFKSLFTDRKFTLKIGNQKSPFDTATNKNAELSDVDDKPLINLKETDTLHEASGELISKLKNAISNAASKKVERSEFILLLQLTLQQYPMLKYSSFQVGINDLIIQECEKYSFITLSAEDMVMIWNKVK